MTPDAVMEVSSGGALPQPPVVDKVRGILAPIRAAFERRHQLGLQHLAEAERQLENAFKFADSSEIDVSKDGGGYRLMPKRPVSGIKIVRQAIATFGDALFSLDDLANRVARENPGCSIGRAMLSRRLFDLRRFGEVTLVQSGQGPHVHSRKQKKRYYRLMPPKSS